MQKPDGTRFWALIHARRFEFEGEDAVLAVVLDDTARREAMARAKLLETAIEQSSEPVMLLDLEGQVVLANMAAAEVYGLDPGQMIGRHVAELRGGRPGDELHRSIVEHIRHGENWQGEFQLKQGDEVRTIARRVSPVFDERGELAWQIVIDRDVTEERQRQERMEHVQRLESLGVLAGGIAHDFNNLLAAIMGHASLARMKASPADPLLKHVEAIEKTSERAAELCQQMLAYAGKGRFVVRPINLSELVLEMTRLLEVSLHKGVVLRYELEPNLPAVEADAAQMQQVVMNLVTNANEAIGENSGIITLATGMMQADEEYLRTVVGEEEGLAPGRYVWLEVSDTGCGMDEETKARIFEPFFTTKFTGRGLGMSAILGIVRGHHGAIKIYSEPGRGTTIKVLL
ncbi:MAG: PAS domain S-box protein, partial [Bacteroidetes bacterium]